MNVIKRVPVPLAGVMLGTAALGNLLQSYSNAARNVCGIFAAFLLVLLLLRLVCDFKGVGKDMGTPVVAGVSGTFTMALMILSTYLIPFTGRVPAQVVWYAAIVLHAVLIVCFTAKYILHFDLKKVFTVYYIVYVGIAVVGVTAPAYGAEALGAVTFWFGLVTFVLLFVVVTVRYAKLPVPEPAKPLIVIYAAPLSLCVAAYVQSVAPKNLAFLLAMVAIAQIIYLFALVKAVSYLKLPFYPSYAAFTFPLVISAIALKQTMACCAKLGFPIPWLGPIVTVETVVAVAFVAYVYIRFMMHIFGGDKAKA